MTSIFYPCDRPALTEPQFGRMKRILIFENGKSNCYLFNIVPRNNRSWISVLEHITKVIRPSFGPVKRLLELRTCKFVTAFEELDPDEKYVALGLNGTLKMVPGGYTCSRYHQQGSKRLYAGRIDSEMVCFLSETRKKGLTIIYMLRNGMCIQVPRKVVLRKEDLNSWDLILRFLGQRCNIPEGVAFVCTIFGEMLCDPREFQHGYVYVAIPYQECFVRLDYLNCFQHLCCLYRRNYTVSIKPAPCPAKRKRKSHKKNKNCYKTCVSRRSESSTSYTFRTKRCDYSSFKPDSKYSSRINERCQCICHLLNARPKSKRCACSTHGFRTRGPRSVCISSQKNKENIQSNSSVITGSHTCDCCVCQPTCDALAPPKYGINDQPSTTNPPDETTSIQQDIMSNPASTTNPLESVSTIDEIRESESSRKSIIDPSKSQRIETSSLQRDIISTRQSAANPPDKISTLADMDKTRKSETRSRRSTIDSRQSQRIETAGLQQDIISHQATATNPSDSISSLDGMDKMRKSETRSRKSTINSRKSQIIETPSLQQDIISTRQSAANPPGNISTLAGMDKTRKSETRSRRSTIDSRQSQRIETASLQQDITSHQATATNPSDSFSSLDGMDKRRKSETRSRKSTINSRKSQIIETPSLQQDIISTRQSAANPPGNISTVDGIDKTRKSESSRRSTIDSRQAQRIKTPSLSTRRSATNSPDNSSALGEMDKTRKSETFRRSTVDSQHKSQRIKTASMHQNIIRAPETASNPPDGISSLNGMGETRNSETRSRKSTIDSSKSQRIKTPSLQQDIISTRPSAANPPDNIPTSADMNKTRKSETRSRRSTIDSRKSQRIEIPRLQKDISTRLSAINPSDNSTSDGMDKTRKSETFSRKSTVDSSKSVPRASDTSSLKKNRISRGSSIAKSPDRLSALGGAREASRSDSRSIKSTVDTLKSQPAPDVSSLKKTSVSVRASALKGTDNISTKVDTRPRKSIVFSNPKMDNTVSTAPTFDTSSLQKNSINSRQSTDGMDKISKMENVRSSIAAIDNPQQSSKNVQPSTISTTRSSRISTSRMSRPSVTSGVASILQNVKHASTPSLRNPVFSGQSLNEIHNEPKSETVSDKEDTTGLQQDTRSTLQSATVPTDAIPTSPATSDTASSQQEDATNPQTSTNVSSDTRSCSSTNECCHTVCCACRPKFEGWSRRSSRKDTCTSSTSIKKYYQRLHNSRCCASHRRCRSVCCEEQRKYKRPQTCCTCNKAFEKVFKVYEGGRMKSCPDLEDLKAKNRRRRICNKGMMPVKTIPSEYMEIKNRPNCTLIPFSCRTLCALGLGRCVWKVC